jgi:hypothetical protein
MKIHIILFFKPFLYPYLLTVYNDWVTLMMSELNNNDHEKGELIRHIWHDHPAKPVVSWGFKRGR